MKNLPQFIALAVIIFGGFWIGSEWGSQARPSSKNPIIPEVPQSSVKIVPVIVPTEEVTNNEPLTPTASEENAQETPVTPEVVVSTNTTIDPNLPKKISDTMNHYSNSNFRYEFDIPANVYYAGFGAVDGARHTVGISKEDPETLTDAAVRVYFYGKKVVPELQNAQNNKYEDPAGTFVYLLLDGAYSVKIEAVNINHPIVQKIIETIKVF
ncbi:hypothetical protein KBB89_01710 [Candidatus Gracilibacteria bacterium]|nr:hypothetical protein [Candidatus Gracilibacteria bacterium]